MRPWKFRACINVWSLACVGLELGALSGGATPAGLAWPTANDAIFVPLYITEPTLIKRLFILNGGTVSGNLDLGIYTADGGRLRSSGSTAQSGTTAIQFVDITDIVLGSGRYYLACAMNGTTGTAFRANVSAARLQQVGVARMASAFALPSSATLVAAASGYMPLIGAETYAAY